jgi:chaperonin GroES
MNIRPLHDYVIVRRTAAENLSAGGIVIPDSAAEKPSQGEIVAVGNGRALKGGRQVPLDVKPGDRILFGRYTGTEIKFNDEELIAMRETDIMAVLEG